ncbi:hypothetical protein C0J52_12824 [Blattella germanica]|nr:hypothetical protein C0J52_12824 [Blattella germanica]
MAQSVGGSLLSIGSIEKRKGLKKFAKNLVKKGKKSEKDPGIDGSTEFRMPQQVSRQVKGDADPGVISEGESEDDFTFDDLSHKSSGSSLNTNQNSNATPVTGSLENLAGGELLRRSTITTSTPTIIKTPVQSKPVDEWEQKLYGNKGKDVGLETLKRRSWDKPVLSSQPEEDEPEPLPTPRELSPPPSRTLSPVSTSSVSSSPAPTPVPAPRKLESEEPEKTKEVEKDKKEDEKEKSKEGNRFARKFKQFRKESKLPEIPSSDERIIIGGENEGSPVPPAAPSRIPREVWNKFEGKSKEDLIEIICNLQMNLEHQNKKLRDLEDYLDNLLLRVMETTPRILQNPYVNCKTQAHLRTKSLV